MNLNYGTIRQNKPGSSPQPVWEGSMQREPNANLTEQFTEAYKQDGAGIIVLQGEDEVNLFIKVNYADALDCKNPETWAEYQGECSVNKLERIETAILKGHFGVAENGAIWLDESSFPNRIIPFISKRLIVKLSRENLYGDMNAAYENIDMNYGGFCVFISGPSKTADIEQSLVYGAHGAKEHLVIIY